MRLAVFETKKIWKNRLLLPVLVLLLAVTFVIFYEGQGLDGPRGRKWVIASLREDYDFYRSLTEQEKLDFREAMTRKYAPEVFSAAYFLDDSAYSLPGYFGDSRADADMIYTVRVLEAGSTEIREVLDKVTEGAKFFGRQALKNEDDYEVRRNLRIIALYGARAELTSEVRNWDRFLFTPYPAFIALFLIFFAVSWSFSGERDRKMDILLRTSADGRRKTAASKYAAGMLFAVAAYLLVRGVSLASVAFNYGLMGLTQPVWGIRELLYCPYRFTVWQYALVSGGCELLAALVMAVLFAAVSALCRNGILSYIINALLLGGSIVLYYVSPHNEWLKGPLALLSPLNYFESYYTADILNCPVPWVLVQILFWVLISAGLAVLGGFMHNRVRNRL